MKKIMFSDKYGLTQAVLDGRKTMTRRIIPQRMIDAYEDWLDEAMTIALPPGTRFMPITDYLLKHTPYCIGEVVAIAQSYKDCGNMPDCELDEDGYPIMPKRSGFFNKMFVRADLMPHHIRITNVKIERLQDISDEECRKEGICRWTKDEELFKYDLSDGFETFKWQDMPRTPREAFAALIDKVSGKGVWESNPWVFAYEFELID